jgi:hypothetical protein
MPDQIVPVAQVQAPRTANAPSGGKVQKLQRVVSNELLTVWAVAADFVDPASTSAAEAFA